MWSTCFFWNPVISSDLPLACCGHTEHCEMPPIFFWMKVGNTDPGPDEMAELLVKSRCTRNTAANYEEKMLVLLAPVKGNKSNFGDLTSRSGRRCCTSVLIDFFSCYFGCPWRLRALVAPSGGGDGGRFSRLNHQDVLTIILTAFWRDSRTAERLNRFGSDLQTYSYNYLSNLYKCLVSSFVRCN